MTSPTHPIQPNQPFHQQQPTNSRDAVSARLQQWQFHAVRALLWIAILASAAAMTAAVLGHPITTWILWLISLFSIPLLLGVLISALLNDPLEHSLARIKRYRARQTANLIDSYAANHQNQPHKNQTPQNQTHQNSGANNGFGTALPQPC